MKLEGSNLCMLVVDIMRELINKDAEGANYLKKKCGQTFLIIATKFMGERKEARKQCAEAYGLRESTDTVPMILTNFKSTHN